MKILKRKSRYNFIKEEIIKDIPDLNFKEILQKAEIEPVVPTTTNKLSFQFFNKKIIKPAFTFLFVGLFAILVVFWQTNHKSNFQQDALIDLTYLESYGFSAYSIVSIIEQNQIIFSESAVNQKIAKEQDLEFINSYLYLIETIISPNKKITFHSAKSNHDEYQKLIIYDSLDILGNQKRYYIYFNESPELDYLKMDTLIVYLDKEYQLNGFIKRNNGEIITELVYTTADTKNSIKVENTRLGESNTFTYTIIENNTIYSQSKLSVYLQDNDTVVSLENVIEKKQYKILSINNEIKIKPEDENSKKYFSQYFSRYFDNTNEGIDVDIIQNQDDYYYQYNIDTNNSSVILDRAK